MKKPRASLTVTFLCDRMWGRRTCNWFASVFPEMRGQTLTFSSGRPVEMAGRLEMLEWLMANGYL